MMKLLGRQWWKYAMMSVTVVCRSVLQINTMHCVAINKRETGDWDIFLGSPERARAETGGADQWVLKRRELPGFARVNKVTSASLGYPLSVFNKKLNPQN